MVAAPTREIRYKTRLGSKTYDAIHMLRPNDCDKPDPDFADNPDFEAYRAEVKEWRKGLTQVRSASRADAAARRKVKTDAAATRRGRT